MCQRFGTLCKYPLAQAKISKDYQKDAISLLGLAQERERFLRQYGMHEALDNHYLEENQTEKLFDLRLSVGNLEKALELLQKKDIAEQLMNKYEDQINLLMDYVVAGRVAGTVQHKSLSAHLLRGLAKFAIPAHQNRLDRWKDALGRSKGRSQTQLPPLKNINDARMKIIVAVEVISLTLRFVLWWCLRMI